MTQTVKARFANGVLTPLEAIDLPEGALVTLDIGEIYGAEPVNYNRLNDELMDEEYFEKERRIRERSA